MPVEVPRHLYHTNVYYANQPGSGRICEAGDPEASVLMAPAGTLYTEEDAQRLGIIEYLEAHVEAAAVPAEAKAVEQAAVEDKAVAGPDVVKAEDDAPTEPPTEGGVSYPAESQRTGARRRGT